MMDKKDARAFITKTIESVNDVKAMRMCCAWVREANDFLLALDEAPVENVGSIIFNNGYIRGMEYQLYVEDVKPFESVDYLVKLSQAWRVLVDDFIERAGAKHYGIE